MVTLQLNLIKQWFDLTLQGIKKEEYRNITPHWANRLLYMENGDNLTKYYSKETIEWLCVSLKRWKDFNYASIEEVLDRFNIKFKEFQYTELRNGYKPLNVVLRLIIVIENKGITIGIGKEKWGYTGRDNVFIIHHGNRLI